MPLDRGAAAHPRGSTRDERGAVRYLGGSDDQDAEREVISSSWVAASWRAQGPPPGTGIVRSGKIGVDPGDRQRHAGRPVDRGEIALDSGSGHARNCDDRATTRRSAISRAASRPLRALGRIVRRTMVGTGPACSTDVVLSDCAKAHRMGQTAREEADNRYQRDSCMQATHGSPSATREPSRRLGHTPMIAAGKPTISCRTRRAAALPDEFHSEPRIRHSRRSVTVAAELSVTTRNRSAGTRLATW